ncbi:FRG domain-containing protein [Janthinobacterium tructae]|uniref:FRG domain-containing protein n=1 Tax=Janthinobacterium tructae TaxID=2590869 RepID=A0A4Y6RCH9_9BURK|nr:FRG domain-containing protein [Janthinobacterium tructae]QDG70194.1 FRG domain-containing protein [Janthinobacterium tructae]
MTNTGFIEIHISSWEEFRKIVTGEDYQSWAFRGQADKNWPLFSSLSRYLTAHLVHRDAWPQQEARILRIFKRKAHLLLQNIPAADDSFEWLSIMQHHGAPTRLLDFSWSPFVAAFFALEQATKDAAVWAAFPPALNLEGNRTVRPSQTTRTDEIGPWLKGAYEEHFLPNTKSVAVIGEPHNMNQRLIAQGGTFIMPGMLDKPVEEIAPLGSIVKFVLDTGKMRREAMQDLYRMNINNATLFPGLDGLARSLAFELENHWAFDPITMIDRKGYENDSCNQ